LTGLRPRASTSTNIQLLIIFLLGKTRPAHETIKMSDVLVRPGMRKIERLSSGWVA
jgi:hypothetical protein